MTEKEHIIEDEIPENYATEKGAWPLMFVMGCLLLLGLGIPILLIYYIKSPPIDQLMPIMGISYSKLVYIFLVSTAIITYASVLFLRARPIIIFPVFVILLYCCFPFIVGLRNNLPIKEAIIDTPLLSHLPFFIKPAYLFFEFFVPTGILICLFLQIKNILSKKSTSFAFLSLACFLGTAAVLGSSILTQAGIPNLVTIAKRSNPNLSIKQNLQQAYPIPDENQLLSSTAEIESPANTFRVPGIDKEPAGQPDTATLRSAVAIPKEVSTMHEIDQKFQQLSAKLDHLIDIMRQKPSSQQNGRDQLAPANAADLSKHNEPPAASLSAAKLVENKTDEETLEQKLQQVSTRLNGIADTISRIETLLPKQTLDQQKSPDFTPPALAELQTQSVTENAPLSTTKDITQELSLISTKVDQILEALSHDKKPHRSLPKKQ
jgi:hypothetical protein